MSFPKCKYRLVRVHHVKENITVYWIQYPVKILGLIMWWETTSDVPYEDELAAFTDMDALCSESFFELKELWKRENMQ
jgi:hypothetical protein